MATAVDPAGQLQAERRLEGEVLAVCDLECERHVGYGPFVADERAAEAERVAVGRVEGEAGAIEVDPDGAQPQRDPFEDLRQRIGDRRDLGVTGSTSTATLTTTLPRS